MVKNPPAVEDHTGSILGGKIPWTRKWQPPPVILAGNPTDRRPGGLQSWGVARVRYNLATKHMDSGR